MGSLFISSRDIMPRNAGIGRRARTWVSANAGNMYATVVWMPQRDQFAEMKQLNFGTALAVHMAAVAQGLLHHRHCGSVH